MTTPSFERAPDALRRARLRMLLIAWAILLPLPWLLPNDYMISIGVMFFINVLLIGSLNLIMGYCGQVSLCHAGFFGLGAYTSGILSANYGISPWLGMPAAMLLTSVAALLVGLPALRLRGHYLAMATLGANAILSVLFIQLVGLTGGPNGLVGVAPLEIGGFAFDDGQRFYYVAWLIALVFMVAMLNLAHSRIGRAMNSVVSNEIGAASLGVNPYTLKVGAFTLSAAIAALAGAMYVHFTMFASPETFSFSVSVLLVVMVAVGGWGNYWGGLFGALVYTLVPEALRSIHDVELLIFGASMIVVLMFFPGGLAGMFGRLAARRRRHGNPRAPSPTREPGAPAARLAKETRHA
ncbi:branched-chain amino acid ABC transporter permease [Verticiella sediminum]|uniref:Branched-chain amino acid ABC transporter permease n=1 Tax=Verticiella sediminum TaxID=1247510 RepID=A0A556B1Z3_9BURK|nr:branched-chain amino acid ABC transporter permease [Verticiella sediminum]TSH99216.1 branched-chain amino acid ABC transporter permease [Verticiella sediminum]